MIRLDVNVARAFAHGAREDGVDDLAGAPVVVGNLDGPVVLDRPPAGDLAFEGLGGQRLERRGDLGGLANPDGGGHAVESLQLREERLAPELLEDDVQLSVLNGERHDAVPREITK